MSHVIQDEGSSLTARTNLNFVGDGVSATDDAANDATKVTITTPKGWGVYKSGQWYPPGPPIGQSGGRLLYGSTTVANIMWAVPVLFTGPGTITDLATYGAGQGGGTTKVYIALYRSDATRTAPDSRIFSSEHTHANFTNGKVEDNSLGITVSADEIIWFVAVANGAAIMGIAPLDLYPLLGTNFDGTGGANPTRDLVVGYRASYSYAQPPATWTATTYLLASTAESGGNQVAMPVFKFTPS